MAPGGSSFPSLLWGVYMYLSQQTSLTLHPEPTTPTKSYRILGWVCLLSAVVVTSLIVLAVRAWT